MEIPLICPCCNLEFSVPASPEADHAWKRMGDGQTVEDLLYSSLEDYTAASCPSCGTMVAAAEADVDWMAQELISQW